MRVTLVALNAMYVHTNLAVRMLDAAVRQAQPEIAHTVLELHVNQPFETQLRAIWAAEPEVVCFSTYIWNVERVHKLARALKRAIPAVRIALGGPEISGELGELVERLEASAYIDALLYGEGEVSYPAMLAAMAQGESMFNVPGCVGRLGPCGTVANPPPEPVPPEQWPDPYADGLPGGPERIWYVETSRGCPFRCQFCLSAGDRVRALSAEQALARLTRLAEAGARLVKLVDRTFNFDAARAREIWRGLMALDTDCVFHFEIEAYLLDAESLALLADAPKGRFQFEIGIQSTTPEVLLAVRRGYHFSAVSKAVRALREAGNIALHLDLIAGLPGETFASFAKAFDAVYALGAERLQLGFLKLLPGTGLRRDAETLGLVYAPDPPYQVLRTPTLSFAELEELRDVERALDWYGNSGRHAAAMALLLRGNSPFAAYHALSKALRAAGAFDADRSAAYREDELARCAALQPGIGAEELAAALLADQQNVMQYKRYKNNK